MSAPHHPLILGHRGASAAAPDNTLAAYALAVAQNADGIELDVRRTADGTMVLHHDAEVEGVGCFVDMTFDDVRARLPDVPTLDEMLAVTGDLLLDIEIKNHERDPDFDPDDSVAHRVVGWIQEHRLHPRVMVSSFNPDTVDRARSLDPSIPTGQLLWGSTSMIQHVADVARRGHEWILPADAMLGSTAARQIAAAHEKGLRVMVWTVDDPGRIAQLAAGGIDGIITNDPAGATAVFE